MIPLQLTLKNFLSYREATLDFRGLHTACICGANGAGKSSLLEAITWVIWGKTRTATEDDVIHAGVNHVRVDFDFICHQQTYRIIRSRSRGKSSALEFQVVTESGRFRSITAKGMKATQEEITTALKLDYDTFINSAYLRQGRADEFMLRRPSDRKQILADLLKLDRYEQLAVQSKDLAKEYKGQAEQLRQSIVLLEEQLAQEKFTQQELISLETQINQLQQLQEQNSTRLQDLQVIEHQRQAWEQQITVQETQYQNLLQDCDRLSKDLNFLQIQLQQLEQLIAQEPEIVQQYNQLLSWQEQEKDFLAKFATYQQVQKQLTQLEQQLNQQNNELNLQIRQVETRLEAVEQQEQEIEQVLARSSEVEAGLEQLNLHRQRLVELDRIQQYVAPLLQQKNNLQLEIEKTETKLNVKLEQIQQASEQLAEQIAKVPQMRQAVLTIDAQIDELDKKKVYQKRVREKGEERRDFQTTLQANQRVYERQFQELQQKLDLLGIPEAVCPLCERELDEHHRSHVIDKTQKQQKEIQEQIWVIREQLAACERELQLLRKEYKQLDHELTTYDSLQLQIGQLEAQLEATGEIHKQLKNIKAEQEELENLLGTGNYAQELQLDLTQLNNEIKNFNYDEQTHALVRGEVERWRWAEIKQVKIEDAKKRQANLESQKPQLLEQIQSLQQEIKQLHTTSEIQQQIEQVQQTIAQLGYDQTQHQNLLTQLRQAQTWYVRYQELTQAKQQYPQLQIRLQELQQLLELRLQDKTVSQTQIDNYITQREQINDYRQEIKTLEQQIHQRRQQLDELIIQTGRLQQTLVQIKELKNQYTTNCQQLKEIDKNYRIYQELGQAFGKNGIQALMIENILPQLEAETNHILARLTGNQFHVQFLTQKAGKSSSKKTTKLIDTLDILIADARGTRPYETYSGGEAFRINFSIRLALAKLLAQRAGTSLQLLIVDEGFGTQDSEGCERLVAAINAIASDFACILTVTHMPQFKEAFQTRIEVYKSDRGSLLRLSN
ncbi:exonuclease SbcC [Stanieria cyanosphaera PCC 7437]|uniref:Nuclease SbcCD subunit C n=1 Tax=Stanieria cyanosphaera (strain ATCC 29371 / PCC 7437) TaxID=111780 RepID=K9XZI8_STAC7|nr:exonuclease subunit SbcC [Stanieria cyanosphaera]AFZ37541.1 exonuclease SbcC [Stanieria cyanosphaera PCC 7437]